MYSIAIDGPAEAGKTTQAKALAKQLGFLYVDTGAFYRGIALFMLKGGKTLNNVPEVLNTIDMDIARGTDGSQRLYIHAENVTDCLRTPEVSKLAPDVSSFPAVREFLLDMLRHTARDNSVVMEGRDIGTVILPAATCKIFLTASPEARAQRRMKELQSKGIVQDYDTVLLQLTERDYQDSHWAAAPLRRTEDAVLVDNTMLTIEQTTDKLLEIWETHRA